MIDLQEGTIALSIDCHRARIPRERAGVYLPVSALSATVIINVIGSTGEDAKPARS